VFDTNVRNSITTPAPEHACHRHGASDRMAAVDMLQAMPDVGFDISSGLVKNIAVIHSAGQLPQSTQATPGGPLDPKNTGTVHYGSIPRGQVTVIDINGLKKWQSLKNGPCAAETSAKTAQSKLCSYFFSMCGVPDGERVFGGVGGSTDTCAYHTISKDPAYGPISIINPKFTMRAKRMTRCVPDSTVTSIFPADKPTVIISQDDDLCRKINAFNVAKYPDTTGLAYNYP
jgi:hypothetical protein